MANFRSTTGPKCKNDPDRVYHPRGAGSKGLQSVRHPRIYPDEIDEDGAREIGRGYVEQFEPKRIAVGRDMRSSSPAMAKAVIEGAAAAGAEVIDIGLVGTEMLYFAVGQLGLDGGLQVTASHNPKEYTGLKVVRRGAMPVGGNWALWTSRKGHVRCQAPVRSRRDGWSRGRISRLRRQGPVLRRCGLIQKQRVVIDAANGMGGVMMPPVLERISIEPVPYFFEPDGSFPNHEPNPLLPEAASSG